MMTVQRVEKHMIKPSDPYYAMLDHFCFLSKNLYNHANYILRQEFIRNGKTIPYAALDKILKADREYPDYREMPTAQSAQQIVRLLEKNWKSFFNSIKDWKRDSKLSKHINQSFVGIPTQKLTEMIQYKSQEAGINVILTEESYTSGTSFLDREEPVKRSYDKSRRIHRGLFMSSNGREINADINASYQILKKVFPNAYANGIEDVVLHPARVNAALI